MKKKRRPRKTGVARRRRREVRRCATEGCENRAREERTRCNTCRSRANRQRHPLREMWRNLRKSASERGKVFLLPWEFFVEFAVRTGYAERHGQGADGLQVDRIDPARGYEPDNVQVLTGSVHARKSASERLAARMAGGIS